MLPVKLTPKVIEQAPVKAGRYEMHDALVPGLKVSIMPSGHKSFVVRLRFGGKKVKVTLGTFPALKLETARAKAREVLDGAEHGKDPSRKTGGEGSVSALAEIYDKKYIATDCRPGTQASKRRNLAAIVKAWGDRQVSSLTRKDCMALVNAAKPSRGKEFSKNVYNERAKNIAAFLQWCVEQGQLEANPAQRIKRKATDSRDRVLDDAEIAAVWHKATEVNGRLGALVKLLLLTGARRDEIAALRWSEVKKDQIELAANRTKTKVAYDIAITPLMRSVLDECPQGGEFVLNGKFKVALTSGTRAKLNPEGVPHWTIHDLRRTFASGCAALKIPPHVIELCLNHNKKSGIPAIYNRFSYAAEKREAWLKWSAHVEALVTKKAKAAA
jgi:integrase